MADEKIVEVHDGGGGAAMAVAVILLVVALIAILYFTGAFGNLFGSKKAEIDINVQKPSAVLFVR